MCQAGSTNKDEAGIRERQSAKPKTGLTTRVQQRRIRWGTADLQPSNGSAHHDDNIAIVVHANCQCPCLPCRLNGITPQKAIPGVID